jgi:hypothetical protein
MIQLFLLCVGRLWAEWKGRCYFLIESINRNPRWHSVIACEVRVRVKLKILFRDNVDRLGAPDEVFVSRLTSGIYTASALTSIARQTRDPPRQSFPSQKTAYLIFFVQWENTLCYVFSATDEKTDTEPGDKAKTTTYTSLLCPAGTSLILQNFIFR